MLSELQISVSELDWEYIKSFLSNRDQGRLRQCVYAACLFDNVEVAKYCYENGRHFEKATLWVALSEGATKIADFLFQYAQEKGYTDILEKCDGLITSYFVTQEAKKTAAVWLNNHNYIFPLADIVGLVHCDDIEIFQLVFSLDFSKTYDLQKMIQVCLEYKAYNILFFLNERVNVKVDCPFFNTWFNRRQNEVAQMA